ncbi:MAG: hypothetical protein ACR2FH_10945 [Caulobacteraceae bacterium]
MEQTDQCKVPDRVIAERVNITEADRRGAKNAGGATRAVGKRVDRFSGTGFYFDGIAGRGTRIGCPRDANLP